MRNTILFTVTMFIIVMTISSCKKNNPTNTNKSNTDTTGNNNKTDTTVNNNPTDTALLDTVGVNTIVATLNGTVTTFNLASSASYTNGEDLSVFAADGYNFSTANQFEVSVHSSQYGIKPMIYTNTTNETADFVYVLNGVNYYASVNSIKDSVTVGSFNSVSVKGIFHGSVYLNEDTTQTKITVTNGKFNLNF